MSAGYDVYPVHPTEPIIEGLPAFKSVRDIPTAKIDRVAIYLPPAVGVRVMEDVAAMSVGTVYLNPGADAPDVVDKAKQLGLTVVTGCAIIAAGVRPEMFSDE